MNPLTRTMTFVGVALISVGLAVTVHIVSQPPDMSDVFDPVGEPFYPNFDDPTAAKALSVVVYSEDTASIKSFEVKLIDGIFRIPSHHNYPADAENRLAETAASVIGITRGALQTRRKSDHERYGVIDPLDESTATLKGRGQRITLYSEDGKTALVDYIIGKEVEGQDDLHYVRRKDEDEVYRSNFKITLSAKFTDWIESDVLKMDRDNLVEIVVNTYSIDERAGRLIPGEVSQLSREKVGDPWKLDGLDEATEELKTTEINDMVNSLDDLKIVGVRPKPRGLRPDLSVDPALRSDPLGMLAVQQMQSDLRNKGFFFGSSKDGAPRLVSNEGELICKTNEGIAYSLYFGEIFTGSEIEIEAGILADGKEDKEDKGKQDETDGDSTSESKKESEKTDEKGTQSDESDAADESANDETKDDADDQADDDLKASRYLFVRAEFDATSLGPEPQKPEQPTKPDQAAPSSEPDEKNESQTGVQKEEGCQAEDEKADKTNAASSDTKAEPAQATEKSDAPAKADAADAPAENSSEADKTPDQADKPSTDSDAAPETPKPDPQAVYEAALKKYEDDLKTYNDDLQAYQEKLKKGREKVEELNARFGEWYYVISADSFEKLRLSRADMVKPKEKSDEEKSDEEKSDDAKSDDVKSDDGTPKTDTSKPEASGTEAKSKDNGSTAPSKNAAPQSKDSPEAAKPSSSEKRKSTPAASGSPAADAEKSAPGKSDPDASAKKPKPDAPAAADKD